MKVEGVISALGDSSRNTPVSVRYYEDFSKVGMATTLPILILGGPSKGDPRPIFHTISSALKASMNVRGALVGRNISFPGFDDPAAVAQAITKIINEDYSPEEAYDFTKHYRNEDIDQITKYFQY